MVFEGVSLSCYLRIGFIFMATSLLDIYVPTNKRHMKSTIASQWIYLINVSAIFVLLLIITLYEISLSYLSNQITSNLTVCAITFNTGIKLCITGFFSIWIQQWPVIHLIKGQFFGEHYGHTATISVTDTLCKYYKIIWCTDNSFWQHKMRCSFDLSTVLLCFHW